MYHHKLLLFTCFIKFCCKLFGFFSSAKLLVQGSVTVLIFGSLISKESFFSSMKKHFSACPLGHTVCAVLVGKVERWNSRAQTFLKYFFFFFPQLFIPEKNYGWKPVCLLISVEWVITVYHSKFASEIEWSSSLQTHICNIFAFFLNVSENIYVTVIWNDLMLLSFPKRKSKQDTLDSWHCHGIVFLDNF